MPRRALRRALLLVAWVAASALGSGCVVTGRSIDGSTPPPETVDKVPVGAEVGEVLQRLGAPLEISIAPDSMLLIWRKRHYDYDRFELDAGQTLRFVSVNTVLGVVVNNLKLVLERGHFREERVGVLFDRAGRVIAVSQRDTDNARLR